MTIWNEAGHSPAGDRTGEKISRPRSGFVTASPSAHISSAPAPLNTITWRPGCGPGSTVISAYFFPSPWVEASSNSSGSPGRGRRLRMAPPCSVSTKSRPCSVWRIVGFRFGLPRKMTLLFHRSCPPSAAECLRPTSRASKRPSRNAAWTAPKSA